MRSIFPALLFWLLCIACTNKPGKKDTLFELVDNSGINFNNKVTDQEIENSFLFRNFYNGGGVAIGDINNDGLADVMLSSNMGENKLYLNQGNWQFKDITAASGMKQDSMWSTGLAMADVNSDGWLDIYVCNSGHMQSGHRRNKLYINNRNLSFTESSQQYGLDISAYTTHASFFDYDLDGDLDCFMIDNSPMPVNTLGYSNRRELPAKQWPVADFLKGGGDHLYRNDNGKFTEVTREAGIHGTLISFGLGVSVGDINNDGYPDVYIANDSYERDYLYINQKNGTFKDELEACMQQISFSSMGADIADINNDGYADIFTTDMLPEDDYRLKTLGAFDNIDLYRNKVQLGFYHQFMKNTLQLNNGNGTFSEIANYAGVVATDWSWGALMFDADNDGLNDIYVCNGVNKDVTNLDFMNFFANDVIQKMVLAGKKDKVDEILTHIPVNPMPNKAYRNLGNLRFADAGADWGFMTPSFSNGAAYGDLDNDGDLDLIVNNENQPAFIYRNNAKNHSVSVLLKGNAPNNFAIGSKIKAYKSGKLFYRELFPSRGFQSSMDYKVVIGLGQVSDLDSLVVEWPDLTYTKLMRPAVDTLITLQQSASDKINFAGIAANPLFDSVKTIFEKHIEDEYVDFYYERNILKMLSREGPRAAVGDVNKDGFADIYIGGTKDHPGQLYLQTANGDFKKKEQPIFHQFRDFEDGAALFFDADKDGDLDLFIGAAGNNNPPYSRQMQNRLLLNDGQGNFSLHATPLPNNGMNIAVVVPNDFDKDGDTDLFVGSRSVPRNYGASPNSYVYVNDGSGKFSATELPGLGMVTSAVWANVTGDAAPELIVAGEWMSPKIFQYANGRFTEIKTAFSDLQGWWQSVAATDVNGDGKMDLILGNIGENFNQHPTKEKPVKLWMADVDNNNDTDKILTRTYEGRDVPIFLKNDLQEQIPSIKKANFKHAEYAKKSIQELFPQNTLNKAVVRSVNYATSIIAINNGNGDFTIQPLPVRAQLSCINAISCIDINKDGFTDLVLAGNSAGFLPQLEKLDASLGDVFLNNGKGQFTWVDHKSSGILVTGEVKDIVQFNEGGNVRLLFLRNNDTPVMFKKRK